MTTKPKYTIIVPSRNGGRYLPACIKTILSQPFYDYELILSDDHSTDETTRFLKSISHPNLKVVTPPENLSMAAHWEWALQQAIGQWIIFVGQDDGLQPYFFELSEILTNKASKTEIKAIMSKRAYFNWPGCEQVYGDTAVSYTALSKVKIHSSNVQALLSLFGFQNYFQLPEMYTTSLFHRDLIEETRKKQSGKVFVTHPQDANLAAIACRLQKKYLKSEIPLGWVGSSPKSAGMAISLMQNDNINVDIDNLKKEYLNKTKKSRLPLNPLIGEFEIGSTSLYFWGALLQTKHLGNVFLNTIISNRLFKLFIFSGVLFEIKSMTNLDVCKRLELFKNVLILNKFGYSTVLMFSKIYSFFYMLFNLFRVLNEKLSFIFNSHIFYYTKWTDHPDSNMINASSEILKTIKIKKSLLRI